jgi:hypothetical protein
MKRLQDMAQTLDMALCFGYAEREGDDGDRQYSGDVFNSAVCIDSDGSIAGQYRKSHLWQSEERRRFTPGHELCAPFSIRGHPAHKFSIVVCYDVEYPEPARLATLKGTSVLLVLSALADSGSPDLIPTCLVPARALEVTHTQYTSHHSSCALLSTLSTPHSPYIGRLCMSSEPHLDLLRQPGRSSRGGQVGPRRPQQGRPFPWPVGHHRPRRI